MAKKKKTKISVDGREITITHISDRDFISLTDMADSEDIKNWLRNKNTVEFLAEWEALHNPNFNWVEFDPISRAAGLNRFKLSAKQWVERTNAIGLIAKAGRYGGTYAHKDIAFEFGSWISPRFKLMLIKEFDRLKTEEYSRQKLEWSYQRYLTKVNYRLHTDTIKDIIIPRIQAHQRKPDFLIYAEEADLLNMAVFGMTAREWREANPEQARKGNIRDFADINQLNVLANIESMNAILIERGMNKQERFAILSEAAVSQYRRLVQYSDPKQIED